MHFLWKIDCFCTRPSAEETPLRMNRIPGPRAETQARCRVTKTGVAGDCGRSLGEESRRAKGGPVSTTPTPPRLASWG